MILFAQGGPVQPTASRPLTQPEAVGTLEVAGPQAPKKMGSRETNCPLELASHRASEAEDEPTAQSGELLREEPRAPHSLGSLEGAALHDAAPLCLRDEDPNLAPGCLGNLRPFGSTHDGGAVEVEDEETVASLRRFEEAHETVDVLR